MNILEVGCGGGIFCHRIKTYLLNTNVAGLDRDTGHIEYAKQKYKELGIKCTFVNVDTISVVPYAPDNHNVSDDMTVKQINENIS